MDETSMKFWVLASAIFARRIASADVSAEPSDEELLDHMAASVNLAARTIDVVERDMAGGEGDGRNEGRGDGG